MGPATRAEPQSGVGDVMSDSMPLPTVEPAARSGRVHLMREIRFSIDRDWARAAHGTDGFQGALPVTNSWGGWPSGVGVAPYLVLRVVVSGVPDSVTGYLVNIQELDALLRRHAIPLAAHRLSAEGVGLTGESLVASIHEAVSRQLGERGRNTPSAALSECRGSPRPPPAWRLESLRLWTTPHLSYAVHAQETAMVELTQCFEFSASHRLHVPQMSEEDNRGFFGKCNNPHGHGHNYRVEVTVTGPVAEATGRVLPLPQFEQVVVHEVIDRFDHKHLNADTTEFAHQNPSVENIARTIWGLLEGKLSPARLRRVKVWETAKTYAEYEGE